MRRRRVNKRVSARRFRKQTKRTKAVNVLRVQRGGFRA